MERLEASLRLEAGTRGAGALITAQYRVTGDITRVSVPRGTGGRTDGLWRHTCFEFLVRSAGDAAYVEVNVAPSREWAIYAFTDYRTGQRARWHRARRSMWRCP